MKPIRTLLLPTLSLASTALGQVVGVPTEATTTRGALSAMPLTLTTGQPDPVTGLHELLFKDTGDQTNQPARKTIKPASNTTPDYRLSVMFGANAALVVLDAISSGNDQIFYDATGLFRGDALGGWATLAVTVDQNAVGAGDGPVSERRANNALVGADVYSFAADNSLGIDDGIVGKPMLEIPREAVYLPGGTDIKTVDLFLPLIAANGGNSEPLIQNTTTFFFSLTSASAASLASLWNLSIDGATILKVVWTAGTSTTVGSWSAPQIVFSSSALGLTAEDDIDALAMATSFLPNWFSGTPTLVSTVPSAAHPNRNQILAFVNQGTPNATLVPLHGGGGPITGGIRLIGTDNVTGLAGMDPDYGNWSPRIGAPIEPSRPTTVNGYPNPATSLTPRGTRPLGLSVIATTAGNCSSFRPQHTVHVTGWGIPGVANQSAGTIYFALAPEPTNLIADLHYLTFALRSANQHTVQLGMSIPAGVTGDMGMIALFVPSNATTATWSPIAMMSF
jgi:hypothetical protein